MIPFFAYEIDRIYIHIADLRISHRYTDTAMEFEMLDEREMWTCVNCTNGNPGFTDMCMVCGSVQIESTNSPKELAERLGVVHVAAELTPRNVSLDTLYCWDERMLLHKEPVDRSVGCHPERPDRIRAIYGNLIRSGLLSRCRRLPCREVEDREVLNVHSKDLNSAVKNIRGPIMIGGDTYANKHTPLAARLAAGTTIAMALEVAHNKAKNGFAIVRPPGHHAEKNKVCGFCLYNNVAAAAQAVLDRTSMSRILIVDWDVHHGNGVQYIFEEDPRVLYVFFLIIFFFPTFFFNFISHTHTHTHTHMQIHLPAPIWTWFLSRFRTSR